MAIEQMSNDIDLDSPWSAGSPWEQHAPGFHSDTAEARQEATWVLPEIAQPAEEGPVVLSEEELAEVYAQMDAEEEHAEVSEPIGRNGLVLIDDPDWIDMTARNMDYLRHVYRTDLNHADKSVLGVVALHCGTNSLGCTASNKTLAEEANIERDNFRKRLSRLTKDGWVRENGMLPSVRAGMSGTKIRHIGLRKEWMEGGS
ncbi:helix-turn-helix domain-containing protein [Streptomyces sp. NBC_01511]|uniref:hypothetical protein n=1 Tax=Streptomyces sp. NBC_01511 TaxID=2903889 RepID=UPI00386A3CCB